MGPPPVGLVCNEFLGIFRCEDCALFPWEAAYMLIFEFRTPLRGLAGDGTGKEGETVKVLLSIIAQEALLSAIEEEASSLVILTSSS